MLTGKQSMLTNKKIRSLQKQLLTTTEIQARNRQAVADTEQRRQELLLALEQERFDKTLKTLRSMGFSISDEHCCIILGMFLTISDKKEENTEDANAEIRKYIERYETYQLKKMAKKAPESSTSAEGTHLGGEVTAV